MGRKFIRHPANIPIDVAVDQNHAMQMINFSESGLAFDSCQQFFQGQTIQIGFPSVFQDGSVSAQVVWCNKKDFHYEVGVCFINREDSFLIRMLEQACYIEQYRNKIHSTEGRSLSMEEAAQEWINQFAHTFPN